jgi:hypothetical protein
VGNGYVIDYIDLPVKDDTTRPRITYTYGTVGDLPPLVNTIWFRTTRSPSRWSG